MKCLLSLLVRLLVVISVSTAYGYAFWPMHGQNFRRTGQADVTGPTAPTVKWQYDFGRNKYDYPITLQDNAGPVVGPNGIVYQVTNDGFFAINPDGTLKWAVSLYELTSLPVRAAPALSPDASRIYVCDVFGMMFARDTADGSKVWEYQLPSNQDVSYSSLAVDGDGIIYVGTRLPASVYAFYPNGSVKWVYTHPHTDNLGIEAPVAIGSNGNVYCIINTIGLVALDQNGSFKWNKMDNCGFWYGWPTLCVLPDGTVISTGDPSMQGLVAYNADGTKKWERWDIGSPGGFFAGATVSKDNSTIYTARRGKKMYALDAQKGTTKWSQVVSTTEELAGSPILAGNGIIYVMGVSDHVYAVSELDGSFLWQYQLNSSAFYWGPQSPALGPDGTLYVVSSGCPPAFGNIPGRLYAFNSNPEVEPHITSSPQNVLINAGQSASLSVSATGTLPLHYQWFRGISGDTANPVGGDAAQYSTPFLTARASFWVRVTNSLGHADSDTATVDIRGDLNHDGLINVTDWNLLAGFIAAQTLTLPDTRLADLNNDNEINAVDIVLLAGLIH